MAKTIIKTLVGSRAHGLNAPDADWDWRGVYVLPTEEILSLNHKYSGTTWIEGKEDWTSYEIGHFLQLATKGNPSVLELLRGRDEPVLTEEGQALKALFPYLCTPQDAYNAFKGYSYNQRKKFLDDKEGRRLKFAVAYLRTAINLVDLLITGTFDLQVKGHHNYDLLQDIKKGKKSDGEIIDAFNQVEARAAEVLPRAINRQDLGKVNDFLIQIRKNNFTGETDVS